MKNFKLLRIVLVAALCLCSSCEEEWTTLPPETRSGENTFGCYINGQLFVPKGKANYPNPRAIYHCSSDRLYISVYNIRHQLRMVFNIYNPKERSNNLVSDLHYQDSDDKIDIYTGTTGKLYLTKFDTVRKIASGYFSDIKFYYTQENFIWIIQGRFDFKLDIYLTTKKFTLMKTRHCPDKTFSKRINMIFANY